MVPVEAVKDTEVVEVGTVTDVGRVSAVELSERATVVASPVAGCDMVTVQVVAALATKLVAVH
jgi:hypothetical protein